MQRGMKGSKEQTREKRGRLESLSEDISERNGQFSWLARRLSRLHPEFRNHDKSR